MTDVAVLTTRSCTTGWTDWIHGELWLLPIALVRRRLNLKQTRANGYGPTVSTPVPSVSIVDFSQTPHDEHHTNKVIPFEAVASARMIRGRTADGLRIVMRDGTRHKLLWLTRDPATEILAKTLPEKLDSRFHPHA